MIWLKVISIAFLVLAMHEAGHLFAGLLQGFRFQLFVVGPLGIKRDGERLKWYFNTDLGHYGGVSASMPSVNAPDNARKFAWVLLAGPLTSLLTAVFCAALFPYIGENWKIETVALGALSATIFLATTLPSKTGMFYTDRKRFQRLVTPGKAQKTELAMLAVLGAFSQNNNYSEVLPEDIETLIQDEEPTTQFFGWFNLLCFQQEKNGAVDEQAQRHYDELSDRMPRSLAKVFRTELEKYKEKVEKERHS